ncbi:transcription factor bHLH120-like isoform X2 [Prosopis cineraria]|uniref:transcription factor bHLH120-like isoform X2 n=1 Tax=Prosopis cineraria TaxID=364024 RepID=UPI00241036D2|nr:transcription factor bHLH120-like isoform X2 [Prosopis cineraria]
MSRGKKHHITLPSSDNNHDDEKKIIRRETERNRRLQMTSLCESLRSLLPFELIKGKRSVSDHIGEAASYIKELKEKTRELEIKRDMLKQNANPSLLGGAGIDESSSHSNAVKCVSISPFPGGVEISADSGLEENSFPLSFLVEILMQEGCNVVSCVSTQVNGRLYHSIKSEINS